jgi:hypothetical protein
MAFEKISMKTLLVVGLAGMLVWGCDGSSGNTTTTARDGMSEADATPVASPQSAAHDAAHEHEDEHEHEHDDHHGHHHVAPHGGALIVLPQDIGHFELVLDQATGSLTLYCLGSHAENPVRIAAKEISLSFTTGAGAASTVVLKPKDNALTGETVGDTSVFEATSPALVGVESFQGAIGSIEFKGVALTDIQVQFPKGNG